MSPIPGVAGIDYPVYSYVPGTDFICSQQEYPGIYTDIEAGCQVREDLRCFGHFLSARCSTCAHPAESPPAFSALMEPSSPSSILCVTGGITRTVHSSRTGDISTSFSTKTRASRGLAVRHSSVLMIKGWCKNTIMESPLFCLIYRYLKDCVIMIEKQPKCCKTININL